MKRLGREEYSYGMFKESLHLVKASNRSKKKQGLEPHTDHCYLVQCDAMTFVPVTGLEYEPILGVLNETFSVMGK